MRAGPAALAIGLLLAAVLPAQAAWMTFVLRDVGSGERIGMGARIYNEDAVPVLSIVCRPGGLGAMYDTGIAMPEDAVVDALPQALLLGADGGAFDPFPATLEPFTRGERTEMRLVLQPGEVQGLVEYVLAATGSIQVGYRMDEADVITSFDNDSATLTIGAVLGECEGRGGKVK